jgi:hypothetical protein
MGFGSGSTPYGYPSTRNTTTTPSDGQSTQPGTLASNVTNDDVNPVVPAEQQTTDIAFQDGSGLLNVRGGAAVTGQPANPELVNAVTAERGEGRVARSQPAPGREQGGTQPGGETPAPPAQQTVTPSDAGNTPGVPVIPSFIGLVTFGATVLLGWKKLR